MCLYVKVAEKSHICGHCPYEHKVLEKLRVTFGNLPNRESWPSATFYEYILPPLFKGIHKQTQCSSPEDLDIPYFQ